MNALQRELDSMFPGCEALITSRGITAIYLALAAIRRLHGSGEVIVPATVCPSVALAVIYAGMTPRFCDVELDTFCLSEKTVRESLSDTTKAVLVVYLFGKSMDIQGITDTARGAGALVIEDLAQGIGGTFNGTVLGRHGDCAILSFNDKKILPGSAGALVTPNSALKKTADILHQRLPGPLHPHERRELATSFRNLTFGLFDALRSRGIDHATAYLGEMERYYERLFVFGNDISTEQLVRCAQALRELPAQLEQRRSLYELYARHFREDIKYVRFLPNEICWRLPVLLPDWEQQTNLVAHLRSKNVLVSNHYFPASHVLGDAGPINAREIGLRAVNFFVDGKTGPETIPGICREMNRICEEREPIDVRP